MGSSTLRWFWAVLIASLVLVLAVVTQRQGAVARSARVLTVGNTYVVNSTVDTVDADVGDGVCVDANGKCTLRAAIMQANFVTGPDTITLPSGVYVLTRAGDDDADVLGDLDIADDLTIQGADPNVTIVDGNGAVTGDRVFQILFSAKEISLSGLTIRNGKRTGAFDEGGGLFWEGGDGHLRLSNLSVEGNAASYGGGLFLDYSSAGGAVEIDTLNLRANSASAAARGLGANFTANFGGFDLRGSHIYSNTAYEGGGLYFQGTQLPFDVYTARIEAVEVYSNTAGLSGGIENRAGDAAVPVVVLNSRLHDNHAGYQGGAVGNYGTLVLSDTILDVNSAGTLGGGLYNYEGGQLDIVQSTLNGNTAQFGGAIYSELFIHNSAALTLTNSTVSGNSASRDGAGLYANGGQIKLFNTTVASNHVAVPLGVFYSGMGGGLYISATAVVIAQNLLLADNTRRLQVDLPQPDDCYGTLHSLGYNLIETAANCVVADNLAGNITGQSPLLGPLQNNGGSTQTQALLPGSPAIDAGQTPACTDPTGAAITSDQRGFKRPTGAQCDIGAVEYSPYWIGLPVIRR